MKSNRFTVADNSEMLLSIERDTHHKQRAGGWLLFLGDRQSEVLQWLIEQGEQVMQYDGQVDLEWLDTHGIDFIVSHGYRHILKKPVVDRFVGKAINLHISYLPWNRGADPNFWSFHDETPKGVTIHYIDTGIDTGDILFQKRVEFNGLSGVTLRNSYERLQEEMRTLFQKHWRSIKSGKSSPIRQAEQGSTHYLKDLESHRHLLRSGWDTPVSELKSRSGNGNQL